MRVHTNEKNVKTFLPTKEFDAIFLGKGKEIAHYFGVDPEKYEYEVQAAGEFMGDIKWNDSCLILRWILKGSNPTKTRPLASVSIQHFTGNCGIKAIDHLNIFHAFQKNEADILKFIESFVFHRMNCGMLIGSDTKKIGITGNIIERAGKGYQLTEATWNPNYTWDKKHEVFLFWKDLNKEEIPNLFTMTGEQTTNRG